MSFKEKLKNFFKINKNVIKGEIDEVKNLQLTDEDKAQGKAAAVLVASAMAACGFPLGAAATPVLEKVLAYVIRDAKEGVETPEKLIVGRIIKEVKEVKNPQQELYDNLNKK